MEPTLASQITWRQFQIPFGGRGLEKIPFDGMYSGEATATVPLRELRKTPMNYRAHRLVKGSARTFHSKIKRSIVFRPMK
jgi:hypothetical protein